MLHAQGPIGQGCETESGQRAPEVRSVASLVLAAEQALEAAAVLEAAASAVAAIQARHLALAAMCQNQASVAMVVSRLVASLAAR